MAETMEVYIGQQTFRWGVRVEGVDANSMSFSPQISFDISLNPIHIPSGELYFLGVHAKVNVIGNRTSGYAGRAYSDRQFIQIPSTGEVHIQLNLDLNHYELEQIEKLRNGDDVNFQLELQGVVMHKYQDSLSLAGMPPNPKLNCRVPKSDWTERILRELKYKKVWLLEVPELESPEELKDAVSHLNNAWKQFSIGEYKNTLVECRRALEEVKKAIVNKGFEKIEKDEKGNERPVPDWKKFFGDKDIGKHFEKIFKGTWRFIAPGAHTGKSIDRGDANLALMTTHAIVYYAIRRFLENI